MGIMHDIKQMVVFFELHGSSKSKPLATVTQADHIFSQMSEPVDVCSGRDNKPVQQEVSKACCETLFSLNVCAAPQRKK